MEKEGKLTKISNEEFIKIINGDYRYNPDYTNYYDEEDHRLYFDYIYLEEHIAFNIRIKPIFSNIEIYNSKVKSIALAYMQGYSLSFGCTDFENHVILMGEFDSNLSFSDCIFKFEVRIVFLERGENIHIQDCYIESFNILDGKIKNLVLNGSTIKSFRLEDIEFSDIEIYNSRIDTMIFGLMKGKNIQIYDSYGVNFFINGSITKDLIIKIINPNFLNIEFSSFINLGTIFFIGSIFSDKKKMNKIKIENSDLGKINLIDVDLKKTKIKYKSSKISEVSISSIKMFLPNNIECEELQQKQLFLSQLKKIYESRGDTVEAGRYYAEELNVYLATLNGSSIEKTNLILNKYTNNHGQNWLMALYWILAISLILWTLICLNLGFTIGTPFVKQNVKTFFGLIPDYFRFLNPAHPFNFIEQIAEDNNSESSYKNGEFIFAEIIESVSRVVLFYLEYQLVQAFRRFGKK